MSEEETRPRHARVWIRIAANVIDLVVLGLPVLLLISTVLGAESKAAGEPVALSDFYNLQTLANAALLTIVTVLLWVNWDGRTPGKKILGLKIVSYPDYQQFSYGTASVRALLSITGAMTVFVGYIAMAVMIAARSDKRGYHDLIAKTCVIHET